MTNEMLRAIEQGRAPDVHSLRGWFAAALGKKLGILKMPRLLWPSDPKINPPAEYLVWAAVLLEDRDALLLLEGIVNVEESEKNGSPRFVGEHARKIARHIDGLFRRVPDGPLRERLVSFVGYDHRADFSEP